MSRSRRKTPIVGRCICSSEKSDKIAWHQRWRSRERQQLHQQTQESGDGYVTVLEREASNVWTMGKDGHRYWSRAVQEGNAEYFANLRGRSRRERDTLKLRFLRRLMGK